MIEFTLPLPCSVNELYTVARGRKILSKKGRAYKAMAKLILYGYMIKPIHGKVTMHYEFIFPDNRKRDASNYIKQLEDVIVLAEIIQDDSFIISSSFIKTVKKGTREVRVAIKEIECES